MVRQDLSCYVFFYFVNKIFLLYLSSQLVQHFAWNLGYCFLVLILAPVSSHFETGVCSITIWHDIKRVRTLFFSTKIIIFLIFFFQSQSWLWESTSTIFRQFAVYVLKLEVVIWWDSIHKFERPRIRVNAEIDPESFYEVSIFRSSCWFFPWPESSYCWNFWECTDCSGIQWNITCYYLLTAAT